MAASFFVCRELFFQGEGIFANATKRAGPGVGNLFKRCAGSNAIVKITYCGIIFVTADVAYINLIFFHFDNFLQIRI